MIDLRGHMPRFTLKMNVFLSISLETPKMCVETLRTGLCFSKMIDLKGHMPMFTLKMNVFSSISLATPEFCVETLRRGFIFPRQSIWGVTCLHLLENECFPIYLLGNPKNVCWNPQNRACFSKMIDLRGHMPRFTLRMNVFPSISLETPKMCVETLRTVMTIDLRGHMPMFTLKMNVLLIYLLWQPQNSVLKPSEEGFFTRQSIWGVTCLHLLEKWTFSNLSSWQLHKCVLKPSEQGSFFERWSIWEVTCLCLLSKWMFSHLSSWQLHKWVCEILRTGLVFPRWLIWGVTCLSPWKPKTLKLFKMNVLSIYLLGNHKCVLKSLRTGLIFQDYRFEGSHA